MSYTNIEILNAFHTNIGRMTAALTRRLTFRTELLESKPVLLGDMRTDDDVTESLKSLVNDFVLRLVHRPDLQPVRSYCEARGTEQAVIILECTTRQPESEAVAA